MAAEKTNQNTALQLKLETGTTAGGVTTYGTRTFSNVKPTISDDDMLSVGTALAGLQNYTLGSVLRRDTATLVEGD